MGLSNNTILIAESAAPWLEVFHALGNQVVIAGRGSNRLDETTSATQA